MTLASRIQKIFTLPMEIALFDSHVFVWICSCVHVNWICYKRLHMSKSKKRPWIIGTTYMKTHQTPHPRADYVSPYICKIILVKKISFLPSKNYVSYHDELTSSLTRACRLEFIALYRSRVFITTLNMIFCVWLYLLLLPPYPAQH